MAPPRCKTAHVSSEPDDDRVLWDISAAPPLDWRVLNEHTQIASNEGGVVAIAYAVDAGDSFEFCWVPIDDPNLVDVHFGVAAGTGSAWEHRWIQARKATEWGHARRKYARRHPT